MIITHAEMDLLVQICNGKLTKQIAHARGTSIRTVENQRRSLFAKLAVKKNVDLLRIALQKGIVHLRPTGLVE